MVNNDNNSFPAPMTDAPTLLPPEPIEPFDPMKKPLWEIDTRFINPYAKQTENPTWVIMGTRPALPKEGIITFSAKPKKGKSLSTYAFAIPLLSGKEFDSIKPQGRPNMIMVFDMEMSQSTLVKRVYSQVLSIGQQGQRFVVCSLKGLSLDKKIEIIEEMVGKYNPEIVVIDQAGKLVNNVNDVEETNEVTDLLDTMSMGRSVWVIMHENKDAENRNMRGWLGSYLSFANVEAYSVSRDNGIFTVTYVEGRDTDAENAATVNFTLDESGRIIAATNIVAKRQDDDKAECRKLIEAAFGDDELLGRTELKRRVAKKMGKGDSTADSEVTKADSFGIIEKTGRKLRDPYKLNPNPIDYFPDL